MDPICACPMGNVITRITDRISIKDQSIPMAMKVIAPIPRTQFHSICWQALTSNTRSSGHTRTPSAHTHIPPSITHRRPTQRMLLCRKDHLPQTPSPSYEPLQGDTVVDAYTSVVAAATDVVVTTRVHTRR